MNTLLWLLSGLSALYTLHFFATCIVGALTTDWMEANR
jgi:hypothetical protein